MSTEMTTTAPVQTGGVLLLYNRPPRFVPDASNVVENINSFGRHSSHPVVNVNTNFGFPRGLRKVQFGAILVHYSVFASGPSPYLLDEGFRELLATTDAYKIASFQDEHHWCRKRFAFLNEFGFDCVFTMLEHPYDEQVYGEHTGVTRFVPNLPGYVGEELIEAGEKFSTPAEKRHIDIGYRGRPIAPYMGRGALEKREIGERFLALAEGRGLTLDIKIGEEDRLYGDHWYEFLADCHGFLGSESGVSCFDIEDEVLGEYTRLVAAGKDPTIEELERGALGRWDGNIPYRTISPRHFEAAALGVTQILYEGRYSGAMEPMVHYIPLKKDFSNLDEVIERFNDAGLRRELTANAHRDLIASGEYGYERMVSKLDEVLDDAGLSPGPQPGRALARRARHSPPLVPVAKSYVSGGWFWLRKEHPAAWQVLHVLSRPFVVPARALGRLARRVRGAA